MHEKETFTYRFLRYSCWPVAKIMFRFSVEGIENLPKDGPLVVCANHPSILDPPLLGLALPRQVHFLMSKEMFDRKFFGWFGRMGGVLPLDLSTDASSGFRAAYDVLDRGGVIGVFPEGARSKDGSLKRFRHGAAYLALRHQTPILPVAIEGTFRALPVNKIVPRPVKVRLRIMPPLAAEGNPSLRVDRDQLMGRIRGAIESGLDSMRGDSQENSTSETAGS